MNRRSFLSSLCAAALAAAAKLYPASGKVDVEKVEAVTASQPRTALDIWLERNLDAWEAAHLPSLSNCDRAVQLAGIRDPIDYRLARMKAWMKREQA